MAPVIAMCLYIRKTFVIEIGLSEALVSILIIDMRSGSCHVISGPSARARPIEQRFIGSGDRCGCVAAITVYTQRGQQSYRYSQSSCAILESVLVGFG